jgi:polysaccharide export outer membrane protein
MRRAYLIALLLAGCVQIAPDLQSPPKPAASMQRPPYRVQVGDVLAVRFYLEPELNEDVTVRPDGEISTQIAPAIPALNRTTEQVAAALNLAYARELQHPDAGVEVKIFAPERVYVAGEVVAAGEFVTVGPSLTLSQAVARAGGLRVSGDPDHVFVIRRGENDRPDVFAVNYRGVIKGADPASDVRLAPFDVVYVPKTGINATYVWFNQHIQQFVPVSWGFSYNVNPFVK